MDTVCGEDFKSRPFSRDGERMSVFPHEEGTRYSFLCSVVADSLRDSKNMRLCEIAGERRSPVPACAETYKVLRIRKVGLLFVIFLLKLRNIYKYRFWCGFSRQWTSRHDFLSF